MRTIKTNSLEIFKQNHYLPTDIGMVSNNAYLSIVATNKCQMKCSYCINSETDQTLDLPIDKAIENIKALVSKYGVKEAIILGGEPLLHPDILGLIKRLRVESGLEMIRLTTNGIKIKNDLDFLRKLCDVEYGIQGLNISFHNEDFMTWNELRIAYNTIKNCNSQIKVRINTNIWNGNLDNSIGLIEFLTRITLPYIYCDEVRISNIIPKDSFSVNPINHNNNLVLSDDRYIVLFEMMMDYFGRNCLLFENSKTLGFVKYLLIPTPVPIIINWNLDSTVSEQICENNIKSREINTFKCLVSGDISLSWNENNVININKLCTK